MPAVDVFQIAVAAQARNDHGRVFLTDVLVGEEAIDRVDDLHQRHAGNQLRVNHALENGSQQRGRDSFAADVGQHYGQALRRVHGFEEIASDFFAGHVASVHPRKRNLGQSHRQQPLLNGGCDPQFLLVAASSFFGLHQARVLDQLRGFSRDRAQNIVADAGDIARGKARVDVERAHHFAARGLFAHGVVCTIGLRNGMQITVRRSKATMLCRCFTSSI